MDCDQQFGCTFLPPYSDSNFEFYASHESQYAYCNQSPESAYYPLDCASQLSLSINNMALASSNRYFNDRLSYLKDLKPRASCAYAPREEDTPTPTRFLKLIDEYSDHEPLVSPFDHQFRRVADDNKYDNLSFAIAKDAKDAKYLNEMIPNGLPIPHLPEPQYGSNISSSSTSTVNGGNNLSEMATDIPFPNYQLPGDDKLTLINDYAAEEVTREDISSIPTNRLIQTGQKASSSDSLQSDSISTTNSTQETSMSLIGDTPTKKKRGRKPIMDEDPVEKRKRYLERNRAAATRCRNKKKVWVSGLEQRLNELNDANSHLKRENLQLRAELNKFAPFKDSISNFSLQLRQVNSGLDGDQDDRLTGYLSAATINSPSISQANILSHQGLILPMTTSLNPTLYSGLDTRSHITPSTQ